jgi:hypothetical protein
MISTIALSAAYLYVRRSKHTVGVAPSSFEALSMHIAAVGVIQPLQPFLIGSTRHHRRYIHCRPRHRRRHAGIAGRVAFCASSGDGTADIARSEATKAKSICHNVPSGRQRGSMRSMHRNPMLSINITI